MTEGQASSVGDLLNEVRRVAKVWSPSLADPEEIWFRGQAKCDHKLSPVLYRDAIVRLNYDEPTIFERFKALASPHVRRMPSDDWEWYFLARHHGLPSRLLDWSESLLVALYFAIAGCAHDRTRRDLDRARENSTTAQVFDDASPAIWMLDAGTVNLYARREDFVFVPGGERTRRYLPDEVARADAGNELPIAILPQRTNERIAAQHGVFTLHGHGQLGLEEYAGRSNGVIRLARIALDRNRLAHMWHEAQVLGVGRLSVFQDLDSVAAHVAWFSQSEK